MRRAIDRSIGVSEQSRLDAPRPVARRRWDEIGQIEAGDVKSVVMEALNRV